MKLGISISTYSDSKTPKGRYEIIEKCLQSLYDNLPDGLYVSIVSDGMTKHHRNILNKFPFDIIERSENGGISKTKNSGIKSIIDNGCDIGFLCDDDVFFKDSNLFSEYAKVMIETDIRHLCLFLEDDGKNCDIIDYNGTFVKKTPWVNGCFLTFTRSLIEEVGYFKVLPYKYGHEHSNFTRRCVYQGKINYYADIPESIKYIEIQIDSLGKYKSLSEIDPLKFRENEIISTQNLGDYVPFKD